MSRFSRIRTRWRKFLRGETVPDSRILSVSVLAHCVVLIALAWLVLLERSEPVIVFTQPTQAMQKISGRAYLPPRSKGGRTKVAQKSRRRTQQSRETQQEFLSSGTADPAMKEQAKAETKALIQNFKFRTIYGFSTFPKYDLPFQMSGQLPVISASELPPHYEQYVTVEVTIDSEGHVVEARVISGAVDRKIQLTLLAAIREFRYRPAMREGVPIPSQCDIVVHVPS